jgi:hypothetical protein
VFARNTQAETETGPGDELCLDGYEERVQSPVLKRLEKEGSMKVRFWNVWFALLVLLALGSTCILAGQTTEKGSAPAKEAILNAAEVGDKLFPDKVFFRGQSATVQARNSAGVRYSDGFMVLAALVDSSGYSSGIKEKYQGYLLTEVPLEIGGQLVKPGAYGFGFIDGNKFVVMDLGANDLLKVDSTKDTAMKRPMPLQIIAAEAGAYKLYHGRDSVEFKRSAR